MSDGLSLASLFVGKGNFLTVCKPLVDLTGDITCGLFLGECIHWSEWALKTQSQKCHAEGWFYRSHGDWWEDVRLTREQVMRAKTVCAPFGVEYAKKGVPATGHYRINRPLLMAALGMLSDGKSPAEIREFGLKWLQSSGNPTTSGDDTSKRETPLPVVGKPDHQKSANPTTSAQGNPTTSNRANPEQTQSKPRANKPLSADADAEAKSSPSPEVEHGPNPTAQGLPSSSQDSAVAPPEAKLPTEGLEQVAAAADPVSTKKGRMKGLTAPKAKVELATRFAELWAIHKGALPSLLGVNDKRCMAVSSFVSSQPDQATAEAIFVDAVKYVADHPHWIAGEYGFDNLFADGKVMSKAEAYRAKLAKVQTPPPPHAGHAPASILSQYD